jgi:hypothetical protein
MWRGGGGGSGRGSSARWLVAAPQCRDCPSRLHCTAPERARPASQAAKRGGVHANNEAMIRGFWRTHVYLRAQNGGGRT